MRRIDVAPVRLETFAGVTMIQRLIMGTLSNRAEHAGSEEDRYKSHSEACANTSSVDSQWTISKLLWGRKGPGVRRSRYSREAWCNKVKNDWRMLNVNRNKDYAATTAVTIKEYFIIRLNSAEYQRDPLAKLFARFVHAACRDAAFRQQQSCRRSPPYHQSSANLDSR
jgi:hypothetical protein